jgi:hypothetical protein
VLSSPRHQEKDGVGYNKRPSAPCIYWEVGTDLCHWETGGEDWKSQQKRECTVAAINKALEEEVEVCTALCVCLIHFLLSFLLTEYSLL